MNNAIKALVVTMLVGSMALLGIGCGSGGDGSDRAVAWSVDRPVGSNWIRIAAVIQACNVDLPLLEAPIIEYKGNRVEIELRRTPEVREPGQNGCFLSLLTAHRKITFERNLKELVLYDSSSDPPERRWPTETRQP